MADILTDIKVKLDVKQVTAPQNLGILALFIKGTTAGSKTYTDYEGFAADFASNQPALSAASGYFAQEDHAEELVAITYTDNNLAQAVEDYYSTGYEFAFAVGDDGTAAATLAGIFDGKAERFSVYPIAATTDNVTAADTIVGKFSGLQRGIIFAAGEDENGAAYAAGALIGALGNETVGSITWKFKTLTGVKPVSLNARQIKALHKDHIFTYVTKAGINQTSEGFTVSGDFIDDLHGDDWVKSSVGEALQNLLSTTNKVSYDAQGIASINAAITGVLMEATENGIILTDSETNKGDYTVTTKSRAETSVKDVSIREYKGASFTYTRSGAIHTVTVTGEVSL